MINLAVIALVSVNDLDRRVGIEPIRLIIKKRFVAIETSSHGMKTTTSLRDHRDFRGTRRDLDRTLRDINI